MGSCAPQLFEYVSRMQNDIYFETLGEAVRSFVNETFAKGGTLTENEQENICLAFNGGVSYGQTVSRSFELMDYKGKKTKKYAHLSLYRMESGRYEKTSYVL